MTARIISVLFLAIVIGPVQSHTASSAPVYTYRIVNSFPHDPDAFTQGLEYHDGFFYEGTGLTGRSSLRKVNLETGAVLKKIDLAPFLFGEGITIIHNRIVQITWQSHSGMVYDLNDFHLIRRFSYEGEGWGLTNNGRDIFFSDGTSDIRILDPESLKETRRIHVHDGDAKIDQLNELEWVNGEIYANIWQTDRIARISPTTGAVVAWIDLSGLLGPMFRVADGGVLNGIAYDPAHKRLFVTGKLWPRVFEIRLLPKR